MKSPDVVLIVSQFLFFFVVRVLVLGQGRDLIQHFLLGLGQEVEHFRHSRVRIFGRADVDVLAFFHGARCESEDVEGDVDNIENQVPMRRKSST